MFDKEIRKLKKNVAIHIIVQLCFIVLLILFSLINTIFIYIFVILFIIENTFFNFIILKCPRCNKLLRNPFKPRLLHLPETCIHCNLKIIK